MALESNQEEAMNQEFQQFLSTLPRQRGMIVPYVYQYQGFWYPPSNLEGVISLQQHFHDDPHSPDILLVTFPKSGTTWLKSILFTLSNRNRDRYAIEDPNHPLLTTNPHDLLPLIETKHLNPNFVPVPSSRTIFATHMPWVALPEPIQKDSSTKRVYLYRNPKDVIVSFWHFANNLRPQEVGLISIADVFECFCKGDFGYGPYWDHVLDYWRRSKEDPDIIIFIKYEDMKEQPGMCIRRLAEFLDCPFSPNEEKSGVVEGILKLCSFESLSSLEVNKSGKTTIGVKNSVYFRQGKAGDWNNHLSNDMVQKLDRIIEEKFSRSGLVM